MSSTKEPLIVSPDQMVQEADASTKEEYASQAKLLHEFTRLPTIDRAWIFKSDKKNNSQAMFSLQYHCLLSNKERKLVLSSQISKINRDSVDFQWCPFPIEMVGVSAAVPSPSGSKLLVIRNKEDDSPTQFEIWGAAQLQKEISVPKSVHRTVYTDGWFEGISWNSEEDLIAYVAEEPIPKKPVFNDQGYKGEGFEKDCGFWKGQGDWEEDWGETYSNKRRPSLFVINIHSGQVQAVQGISDSLSAGQVIWAPSSPTCGHNKYLVFVGWSSENGPRRTPRKFGIKYCYNRPCAIYVVPAPIGDPDASKEPFGLKAAEDCFAAVNMTHGLTSAFFPRFSPDGKILVFLSAKSAVDSGAHAATESLHRMDWNINGKFHPSTDIIDVVPVMGHADDGCFPGLYCSSFLHRPWLSDGCTMILSCVWRSTQVILSVNILSCKISRISPSDSIHSWNVLALDGDDILAESSSPINPPLLKYGCYSQQEEINIWNWVDVESPFPDNYQKVKALLSSHKFDILKIPVRDTDESLSEGAKKPFDAIYISLCKNKCESSSGANPLIVFLHGGPHSVSLSGFSKSIAFLTSIGYNMLIVNYRGSLGFGEEALQSLPGKVGERDVNDVLAAVDYVIMKRLADPSKVAVFGGSHGGFLTTHLIGQAPEKFAVAAVRNPVCNLSLMVGTTDIPDWCYFESCGTEAKNFFTEAPSIEHLSLFHDKSPIAHVKKVKAPVLFLLGAKDLRVPISNGLQYARALKERGVEVKVILFPEDVHGIVRPQSDFEGILNTGVWFRKYCK